MKSSSTKVSTTVGVVDVGIANLGSIICILQDIADHVLIIRSPADIDGVDRLILPGVGAFPQAIARLAAANLSDPIIRFAREQHGPVLGICLGMQLLATSSEEHTFTHGLGLITGAVRKLRGTGGERVPHVGWNAVDLVQNTELMEGIPSGSDFYFVHSFVFDEVKSSSLVATTTHGERFSAVIVEGNLAGVQFHPEKSSNGGRRLLRNFCEWCPC
jgi:glutamine amidotransferase